MSGSFADMLQRISDYLDRQMETRRMVIGAMVYPCIIGIMAIVTVVFMLTFVLPKFTTLFQGKEDILPTITKVVLATSHGFVTWWPAIIGGTILLVGGFIAWIRTPGGRQIFDRFKVSVPVLGPLARLLYSSRLLRTMGVMLESGIPLLDGVEVTRGTVGNTEYASFLDRVEENVRQGKTLSEPFSRSTLFTPIIKQMVSTAEVTGSTGIVMLKMADHYEEEMTVKLKGLTALLEPAIVVAMGVAVGIIALALFLPLFKLSSAVG